MRGFSLTVSRETEEGQGAKGLMVRSESSLRGRSVLISYNPETVQRSSQVQRDFIRCDQCRLGVTNAEGQKWEMRVTLSNSELSLGFTKQNTAQDSRVLTNSTAVSSDCWVGALLQTEVVEGDSQKYLYY